MKYREIEREVTIKSILPSVNLFIFLYMVAGEITQDQTSLL